MCRSAIVTDAAHLWVFEQGIPTGRRDSRVTQLRQRENLVTAAATCVQHMQKALTEMNIQLADVISDISGITGMAILQDIEGERNSGKLARHKHAPIRATRQEIARRLEGTWRPELLFALEQSLDLYDTAHQVFNNLRQLLAPKCSLC